MRISRRPGVISAGDLKDRLELMAPTYTADGRGGQTVTFALNTTVWCQANPASNSRTLSEAQVTFFDAFKFRIRVSTVLVKADWQIVFNDRTYTIHTIQDIDNQYQYYDILAYSPKL